MQDGRKTVWSIPYISVVFFRSLKQNFTAYRSSKVFSRPDWIFEIPQLWQSGFSRVYSNCCCSCSFKPEIINIVQSSHKMYKNNIVNFQESTWILNACTKKVWKLIEYPTYLYILGYMLFDLLVVLIGFNGISTIVEYLMPNSGFTFTFDSWFVNTFCRYTQQNDQTVRLLIIQLSIGRSFAFSLKVKQFNYTHR